MKISARSRIISQAVAVREKGGAKKMVSDKCLLLTVLLLCAIWSTGDGFLFVKQTNRQVSYNNPFSFVAELQSTGNVVNIESPFNVLPKGKFSYKLCQ